MTEQPGGGETERERAALREWLNEAEEALERTGQALRAAWEASREARMSSLESAKQAARQLGEAIDRGVDEARGRWVADRAGEGPAGEASEEE